jgi:peptidoglycan hydrolase-like protein with peptidoglycan-binding domain
MNPISSVPALGSVGKDVLAVQNALKTLGFNVGTLDGIYGAKTSFAIADCQRAHDLFGSGEIGPRTLQILGLEVVTSSPTTNLPPVTKTLPFRSNRHLHPTLRVLLEAKVFPGGVVPQAFVDRDLAQMVILTANGMEALGIREKGGNNYGREVGFIQSIIGSVTDSGNGDAWCMSTDQCIVAFVEDYLQIVSPMPASEGCLDTLARAKRIPGLVTTQAEVATMFIGEHGSKGKGHTGTVLALLPGDKMRTFEGNTSDDNISDGSGAFFRTRGQKEIGGDLVARGFVRLYPNNQIPKGA